MRMRSASIIITEFDVETITLRVSNGGQPYAFANALRDAFAGSRNFLSARHLLLLIGIGYGARRLRDSKVYFEQDSSEPPESDYRYELLIKSRAPTRLRACECAPGGAESTIFDNSVELFLTNHLRRRRRPRGPTPIGYDSRAAWEEEYNSRFERPLDRAPNRAPNLEKLREDILDKRAKSQTVRVDLQGVKEDGPGDYAARQKLKKSPMKK